jgi:hypothetical protein
MLTLKKLKASKLSKSLKWVTRGAYFSLSHKLVTRAIFGMDSKTNGVGVEAIQVRPQNYRVREDSGTKVQ